jgi:2-polyprenyl-6-methoxyphenol hydroxylase-like FAD-dependent oxidoreductase
MFPLKRPEVLVVGAGPVGLFAALALAKRAVRVQIVDKEWRPGAHSYALALHPRTLDLLEGVGLLEPVLEKAYRVERIGLYEGENRRAEMCLSGGEQDASFLAVMRQDVLEQLLEEALGRAGVKVLWNHEVSRVVAEDDQVVATVDKMVKDSVGYAVAHTEWVVAKSTDLEVPLLIGTDGHRSLVRRALDADFPEVGPTQHFAVFEFKSDADLEHEMRVVMDDRTTNVLWPLPDGYCRWSFELADSPALEAGRTKDRVAVELGGAQFPVLGEDSLRTLIAVRAPWFTGEVREINWRIVVRFERRLADTFGKHRLWLAGDAGHVTGPVGMQSMNVGLREADDLASIMAAILRDGEPIDQLEAYGRQRTAEWRHLLGLEGGLRAGEQTDPWIRERIDRILPCIPASQADLTEMARQVGLEG